MTTVIEKIPPFWKHFKNYLKHKLKEIRFEDLIARYRIEEGNCNFEKKFGGYLMEAKTNIVETRVKNNKKRKHFAEDSKITKNVNLLENVSTATSLAIKHKNV